jgi:hypothetical protein
VSLIAPSANQVVARPVTMQWGAVSGASRYQLFIYKSDGVTLFNSTFPLNLTTTSYSFNDGHFNETVQWKVRAFDAAGNAGAYSDMRSYTVQ